MECQEPVLKKKMKFDINYFKRYIYVFALALILILGTSYGLTFFKQNTKIGEIRITVGGLTTNVTADRTISLTSLDPVADASGISLNSKEIVITNTSTLNGKVTVTLTRTSGLELTDLRYGLYVNDVLQTIANVPSDGVVLNDAILGSEIVNIKVSLWVKSDYAGSTTTFDGELVPNIELGSLLASGFIEELSNVNDSTITETNGNYAYASNSTNNYVNFNCNNGTCEKWRIVGVENGRIILTADTYFGNTFTNSNTFNTTFVLNDYSLVTSMSTDNHAVYLNKTVKIVGGNGTNANPYIIEDDSTPSVQDKKVIAILTYNNDGTTTTQPIYYGQTNYISQIVNDVDFQGWSATNGGTVGYGLGDIINFATNTTLYSVMKLSLNRKIMQLCNENAYVQKYDSTTYGAAIDDYQGLGTKDVCYFIGYSQTQGGISNTTAHQNGNVIFGDYCWQIVRTTTTGGVKLLYNGVKTADNKCPNSEGSRPESKVFVGAYDSEVRTLSGSKTYGTGFTYSGTTFTLTNPFTATWSENDANSNGIPDYQELIGKYVCGTSSSPTGDSTTCATIYFIGHYQSATAASTTKYTIATSNDYFQIGTSVFNASNASPALVGYMFNDTYNTNSKTFSESLWLLTSTSSMGRNNYYYGDTAEWNPNTHMYDLKMSGVTPSGTTTWSGFYSSAVGNYTCLNSTDTSCATVHYIENATSTSMVTLPLSNGETADDDPVTGKKLVVSSTKIDNANDYSLGTTENIYLYNWYTNYSADNYKGKYVCSDYTSTTCNTMYYIYGTSNCYINYNSSALHNFTYANDVSYNSTTGEYTLVIDSNTKTFFEWGDNYNTIDSAHYTCFENYNNATHSCGTEVYFIYSTSDYNVDYIKLIGVANIETALKKMINYGSGADAEINKYDSAIKGLIDNWYAQNIENNNLTQYLEDAVYCNDRSLTSASNIGGWIKTGSTTTSQSGNTLDSDSLSCNNMTDRFSSNSSNTLAHLRYPVGLLSRAETRLRGHYTNTGYQSKLWLLTGSGYVKAQVWQREESATIPSSNAGVVNVSMLNGVRPVISLRAGIDMTGEGTYDNPYIVTTN